MIHRCSLLILAIFVANCSRNTDTFRSTLQPEEIISGYEFLTTESQALQTDKFANPGYLWVEKGELLFADDSDGSPSCKSCHEESLSDSVSQFPKLDSKSGELLNLEKQINLCRIEQQAMPSYEYESDELLSLTAYLTSRAKAPSLEPKLTGRLRKHYQNGEEYFFTRRGQFNLSCHQCHDLNWGKKLRGDTISQGHLNGFPAYRLEWQSLGSSHRRLRDCDTGVRAEPLPFGDERYIEVELYLKHRANGLEYESPAIRR